ncbi:MAG: MarR family transcriptional regulator [Candidatus Micrarchaeota archaeon]
MVQSIDILTNPSALAILRCLNENDSCYKAELTKKTGLSKATIWKWLKELPASGFVKKEQKNGRIVYSLDKNCSLVRQLLVLLSVAKLHEYFSSFGGGSGSGAGYGDGSGFGGGSDKCYLYGSLSRGEGDSRSDIDLLVISGRDKKKILQDVDKIAGKMKKKISPAVFTPVEFSALSRKDKPFYERLIRNRIKINDDRD